MCMGSEKSRRTISTRGRRRRTCSARKPGPEPSSRTRTDRDGSMFSAMVSKKAARQGRTKFADSAHARASDSAWRSMGLGTSCGSVLISVANGRSFTAPPDAEVTRRLRRGATLERQARPAARGILTRLPDNAKTAEGRAKGTAASSLSKAQARLDGRTRQAPRLRQRLCEGIVHLHGRAPTRRTDRRARFHGPAWRVRQLITRTARPSPPASPRSPPARTAPHAAPPVRARGPRRPSRPWR